MFYQSYYLDFDVGVAILRLQKNSKILKLFLMKGLKKARLLILLRTYKATHD